MKYTPLLVLLTFFFSACSADKLQDTKTSSLSYQHIIGKTWKWQSAISKTEKITVNEPDSYTIRLNEESRLEAQIDCNQGGASYQLSEGELSFGPLISTRMYCGDNSQDAVFIRYLQRVEHFYVKNNNLYLSLPDEEGIMVFFEARTK